MKDIMAKCALRVQPLEVLRMDKVAHCGKGAK